MSASATSVSHSSVPSLPVVHPHPLLSSLAARWPSGALPGPGIFVYSIKLHFPSFLESDVMHTAGKSDWIIHFIDKSSILSPLLKTLSLFSFSVSILHDSAPLHCFSSKTSGYFSYIYKLLSLLYIERYKLEFSRVNPSRTKRAPMRHIPFISTLHKQTSPRGVTVSRFNHISGLNLGSPEEQWRSTTGCVQHSRHTAVCVAHSLHPVTPQPQLLSSSCTG